jgi:hypothetical protein
MEKSYIGMGHMICPVCHEKHDEVILVDKRMNNTLDHIHPFVYEMVMGYELCPKHAAMSDEYLALIGTTGDPSTDKNACFTGDVAHIKWAAAEELFGVDIDREKHFAFTSSDIINQLKTLHDNAEEEAA